MKYDIKMKFFHHYYLGFEKNIIPRVRPGEEENVYNFIKAIMSAIEEVETETSLEKALTKMDLIFPFSECEIINKKPPKIPTKKKPRRKKRKPSEGNETRLSTDGKKQKDQRKRSMESEGSEDSKGSEIDEVTEDVEKVGEGDTTREEEIVIEKG